MQLHEAVFTARARLKQAELEAEQWKEELRRLQMHSQEQGQQIHTLRQERQSSQEKTNRCVCVCFHFIPNGSKPIFIWNCAGFCLMPMGVLQAPA